MSVLTNWKSYLGKEPLCNHRPDRGIYIGSFCLPLCARCTGILTGAVAASLARWLLEAWRAASQITTGAADTGVVVTAGTAGSAGTSAGARVALMLGLLMIAPTGIDGLLEYRWGRESNNKRRLLTGLLAGVGCAVTEMAIVALL